MKDFKQLLRTNRLSLKKIKKKAKNNDSVLQAPKSVSRRVLLIKLHEAFHRLSLENWKK